MSRPLRLAIVVVGLAVAVYGIASLTGCWLGKPPWWPQLPEGRTYWSSAPPSAVLEGLEWIALSVMTLGLSLVMAASVPRLVGFFLGSSLVVYAVASLTGGWLGEPPWWRTSTTPVELVEHWERWADYLKRLKASTPANHLTQPHELEEIQAEGERVVKQSDFAVRASGDTFRRPGREWFSVAVITVGLGLVAVGAWSRRRRPEVAP